jgi:hypothetical protein
MIFDSICVTMYSWLKIEFIENLTKFLTLPGWEFSCIDKFYVFYFCLFSIRFIFSYYKFWLILLEVSDFLFYFFYLFLRFRRGFEPPLNNRRRFTGVFTRYQRSLKTPANNLWESISRQFLKPPQNIPRRLKTPAK